MTPVQLQELTSPRNVWGKTVDGRVLYRCFIQSIITLGRIQELTSVATETVPPWHVQSHDGTGWWLVTTEPAWFIQLEKEIVDAYRQPR